MNTNSANQKVEGTTDTNDVSKQDRWYLNKDLLSVLFRSCPRSVIFDRILCKKSEFKL